MNFKQYLDRRRVGIVLVLIFLITGTYYQHHILSGLAWMAGTQDLNVSEARFSSEEASQNLREISEQDSGQSKSFWVREDYSQSIDNLSDREYYVTQQNGTEPPFENELYDEKRSGIYVDVVSGAPLFSSKHKFDSGTGWPSFYRPLEPDKLIERRDPGPLGVRVEIASRHAKTHLGHLFENPNTPTGLRYCMNSASLEFIPAENLEDRGYGEYRSMFNVSEN